MEFHKALKEYNDKHKSNWISYNFIASSLHNEKTGKCISRQALFDLSNRGGKKGLVKYKEQLKEILPEELFNNIDFPQRIRMKRTSIPEPKEYENKVILTDEEKLRLSNVPYVIDKNLYRKCMESVPITQYMHDKVMKKVNYEEERIRKCAEDGIMCVDVSEEILEDEEITKETREENL